MSVPKTTKTMKSVKLRKICWTTFKCSIGKDFYVTTKKFKFCSHPSIIIPLSESFTRTKSSCLLVTMPMSSKISWNSSRFFCWAGNNFLLSLYMDWRTQVMSPFCKLSSSILTSSELKINSNNSTELKSKQWIIINTYKWNKWNTKKQ